RVGANVAARRRAPARAGLGRAVARRHGRQHPPLGAGDAALRGDATASGRRRAGSQACKLAPVKKAEGELLVIDGREVRVTNPAKAYFSKEAKLTKLDVVRYYLAVAGGALSGMRDRPSVLKRFVDGAHRPPFYQKRAPPNRPEWLRTVTLSF